MKLNSIPWVTANDRQTQRQVLAALLTLIDLIKPNSTQSTKTKRPAVLTEEQMDAIADAAAATNGRNIRFEQEL